MKILVAGPETHGGLATSYVRTFQQLGHDVSQFDDQGRYDDHFGPLNNRYTHRFLWRLFARSLQSDVIEVVAEEDPDLLLVFKGWYFKPETIREIQRRHPDTLVFCYNQENPFSDGFAYSNKWIVESIPLYDAYFTWGEFLMEDLRKAGANQVTYVPFAHDPDLHYPVDITEAERERFGSDVAFIGTWSEKREKYIRALLDYDIKVWGNMWGRANADVQEVCTHEAIYGEEFSKVCNSSKIVVDVLREQMIPSHSMKCFEIPACGGFFMCNPGHELDQFYNLNHEIVTFDTADELQEHVEYYLTHDEERNRIAEAGHERVQEYTYKQRAKQILDVVNDTTHE